MPFIDRDHRKNPDDSIPGDRCYVKYKQMMDAWRATPRWTTVDKIASVIWPDMWQRAAVLAFLVFFSLHVMPYERNKKELNGDIE